MHTKKNGIRLLAIGLLLLAACNNSKKEEATDPGHDSSGVKPVDTLTNVDSTNVEPINGANQKRYFYGPSVSVITGRLNQQMHYGPPGFGENPKEDVKEYVFMLTIPADIAVFSNSKEQEDEGIDVTKQNITEIQLMSSNGVDLDAYVNKNVRLSGTLFGSHTAHHYADVLMDVEKLEEVK